MISEELSQEILEQAYVMKQRYSEAALMGLLEAEQTRLKREQTVILGSTKDLVKDAVNFVFDLILKNAPVLEAILTTYVVNGVVEYLVREGIVSAQDLSREQFVIALVVSLVLDQVRRKWEQHQKTQAAP